MPNLLQMLRDRSGNFAISAAMLSLPVIAAIGMAMDFAIAYNKQTELQAAADAAVLAAAASRKTSEADLKAIAQKVITAELAKVDADGKVTKLSIDDGKYVTIQVVGLVPTTLAALIRPEGIRIGASAQAVIGSDDNVEVAMVLDNTYSMVGQKLVDLKTASNALLTVFETQMAGSTDPDKVRFAIVPFSRYVNVGMANRSKSWISVAADSSTTKNVCTTTKPIISQTCTKVTSTCYNDGIPYSCSWNQCTNQVYGPPVTTCRDQTSTSTWRGCVGSRNNPLDVTDANATTKKYTGLMNTNCGAAITQLTSNYTTLRKQIAAMVANDETYIPIGMVWGLNMLSPEEPFTDARAYSDDTKKFMIVMTDGENTLSPNYPWNNGTDKVKADNLMASTCANVKAKGITIFTVGVGITNTGTAAKLAACATDASKAISVKDTSALTAAFSDIARQILAVRLTQ